MCWSDFYPREDLYTQEMILVTCVLLVSFLALFSLARQVRSTYSFLFSVIDRFIYCIFFSLSFFFYRQIESTSRILFTNWAGIEEQREKAADLGRRNQVLYWLLFFFFLSARPLVIKKRGKLLNIIGFPHSIRRCCLIFCQLTSLIIFSAKTYTSKTNSFTARATLQSAFYSLPYPIFLVRSNKKNK